ncbi:MAG TPA: nitrilase-related carbon-nitrogen hydrolase [Steroidobacteraceae bacterium]|nr:nitrilase-related carbon-nitrogen hydrolase [Steroidobacteraceae bacterium]
MSDILVAVVQMRANPGNPVANRAATLVRCEEAARAGAKLIVLPELIVSGYCLDADLLRSAAEPRGGATLEHWSAVARRHQVFIIGGFCERDGEFLFNSAMLVGPSGLLGVYRKLHLFAEEKNIFTPGDTGLQTFDLPFGRIGLCICYDLRFVEVVRALALKGADFIAVPAAWTGGFDATLFDAMGLIGQARGAVAQANLNQVFLLCASQRGQSGAMRFLGSSLVVDPFGQLLCGPLDPDIDQVAVVNIDTAASVTAQVRSPLIRPRADRRTDVYALQVGGQLY